MLHPLLFFAKFTYPFMKRIIFKEEYRIHTKNDKERANKQYRTIEAMFRKGHSTSDIARQLDLPTIYILDVTQKIFAMDMI